MFIGYLYYIIFIHLMLFLIYLDGWSFYNLPVQDSWCFFLWLDLWNFMLHFWHLKSLMFWWRRSWSLRFPFVINFLPHILQPKGFSPEWILMWWMYEVLCFKIFLQVLIGHWFGRRPSYLMSRSSRQGVLVDDSVVISSTGSFEVSSVLGYF